MQQHLRWHKRHAHVCTHAHLPASLTPAPACLVSLPLRAATLGPTNWARWGFACAVGASLYLLYGAGDAIYTRMHGPAPRGATLDALPGSRATAAKRCKDVEAGGGDDVADVSEGEAGVTVTTAAVSGRAGKDAAALAGSNVC